jgi:two-component system, chemotaxis family, protein-glutamate methylesterase/glutaminase
MRVLVVDDSAFMRKAITLLLTSDKTIDVIDTARNGEEAVEKVQRLRPDVVTLDIEMPIMDGLAALSKIRLLAEPRPAVIMCSTLTVAGSKEAMKALRLGAADVIGKDPDAIGAGSEAVRRDLIARVKAVAPAAKKAALKTCPVANPSPLAKAPLREYSVASPAALELIVIGSSTGGPPILEQVLMAIPSDLHVPVVVAQHMPAMFTKSMAERLGEVCKVQVLHAEADALLQPGTAYITIGGKHSRVHKIAGGRVRIEISGKPEDALYKPCVNELFASAAVACKDRALGVMLTGMGDDGCIGAKSMHAGGAAIVAQLGETCAVYGMPRAVVDAGIASAVLTPEQIGRCLAGVCASQRGAGTSKAA